MKQGNNIVGFSAAQYRYDGSLFASCMFIAQDCIKFSMGKAGFVNRKMRADVLGKDEPLLCIISMFPILKTTELVPIVSP
ncbi:hypothetical protein [Sphingobacterium hungaricum]